MIGKLLYFKENKALIMNPGPWSAPKQQEGYLVYFGYWRRGAQQGVVFRHFSINIDIISQDFSINMGFEF